MSVIEYRTTRESSGSTSTSGCEICCPESKPRGDSRMVFFPWAPCKSLCSPHLKSTCTEQQTTSISSPFYKLLLLRVLRFPVRTLSTVCSVYSFPLEFISALHDRPGIDLLISSFYSHLILTWGLYKNEAIHKILRFATCNKTLRSSLHSLSSRDLRRATKLWSLISIHFHWNLYQLFTIDMK